MPPDQKPSAAAPKSLDDALHAYQEIETFLSLDEETVRLPLTVLVAALPPGAIHGPVPPEIAGAQVSITVDDLFFKLSKGRVTVTVRDITEALPPLLVAGGITANPAMEVKLPLAAVVAAVDPKLMREKMAARTHKANLSDLPDPFSSLKGALDNFARQGVTAQSAPVPPPAIPPRAPPTQPPAGTATPPVAVPPRPVAPVQPPVSVEPAASANLPPSHPPTAPAEPVPPPEPEVVTAPVAEHVTAATPSQAPKPRPPAREKVRLPAEQELDYLEPETLGGVNVNTATEEQLLTLRGLTPLLAKAIVAHRERNGQFESIFDLIAVPRLGRTTFRKMTGMPFNENHLHRRRKLSTLLGIPASKVGYLPEVAAAVICVPGLAGCVISDRDGLLLAESGASGFATAMSAVVPKMFRQMHDCMSVVEVGSVNSVSLCIRDRMFTIVSSDNLSLTVVHQTNRLTKTQIAMVRKIADELTWMLSHRAYVGKTI